MRVPPELLTVPIFLGGRDSSRRLHYGATAFLVGYPTPLDPRCGSTALVTARHGVLRAIEAYGNVWIRLNTRDGRARDIEIAAPWQYPEDPAADVAAVPFHLPSSGWEVLPIATDRFVTSDIVAARGVGPGDKLALMTLSSARTATERNVPIVRGGAIASMPHEPFVDRESAAAFSAYLVETQASVGLGGSPVFVALDPAARGHADDAVGSGAAHYLLGLTRGQRRQDAAALDAEDCDDEHGLSAAIAMVTPATELTALLQRDAFVEFGRNMDKVRARETGVNHTSDAAGEDQLSEFDRFERLTRALVAVPRAGQP